MEQLQEQHHIEDVGRILLQTQDQLRQLREQLAIAAASGNNAPATSPAVPSPSSSPALGAIELEEILQRAERELRLKAELVLGNLVTQPSPGPGPAPGQTQTLALPALGASAVAAGHPYHHRHHPHHHPRRRHRSTTSPADEPQPGLEFFRRRFTNDAVEVTSPQQRQQRQGPGGRLARHKTTPPARLLPSVNKYDPTAPAPVLSPADARQGVLSLLHRGFLPPTTDLTPAFAPSAYGSVLKQHTVKLHARGDQPVRAVPYANPSGFNLAALKFDMAAPGTTGSPPPRGEDDERPRGGGGGSDVVRTVTISFPGPTTGNQEDAADATTAASGDESSRSGRRRSRSRSRSRSPRRPTTAGAEDRGDEDDGDPLSSSTTDVNTPAGAGAGEPQQQAPGDDANSMDDLRRNVDKIRGYNELLDAYSLHQFIIHKGRAMRDTPEFQSFRRVGQEIWGSIEEVLRALEQLLTRYFVPLAYIDGQRLMAVASMEMAASLGKRELLSCIVNEDQVASLLRRPGQRYKGKDRKRRAAVTLQSFFRMLRHRNHFRQVRRHGVSAMLIQKRWRAFACQQQLHRRLALDREARAQAWHERMLRFRADWPELQRRRRVIVHLPSLSADEATRLSAENFAVRQNLQLARLGALVDAQVEILYVVPFELPDEVAQYTLKLLELGGIPSPGARVRFVVPEHAPQFPAHASLAALVLYSPHCLARLRRLLRGRERDAYVVAGLPGPEDQRLAQCLGLPLLGLEDPTAARTLLSRAGAKRLFIRAEVHVPAGTYDLYDVGEVLFALTKLILAHPEQRAWLLRLDHDPLGTGTCVLEVATLETLRDMRREGRPPEYWRQPGVRDSLARTLLAELERRAPTLARLSHPEVYGSWGAFVRAMGARGVVLEALPAVVHGQVRVNLFVSPPGDVHVLSTHELLRATDATGGDPSRALRRPVALAFPQTLVPFEALRGAATAIGRTLHAEHGFMGYASVDLQFLREDTAPGHDRLWAVGLHPFLTDAAASFGVFHALHRGLVHPHTGLYHLTAAAAAAPSSSSHNGGNTTTTTTTTTMTTATLVRHEAQVLAAAERIGAPRGYVVADYVYHPNVATLPYSALFHTCRRHGVCLDVAEGRGTVFLLADSLTAGVLGLLSTAETLHEALQFLRTAFEVLGREVGTQCLRPPDRDEGEGEGEGEGLQAMGNFAEILGLLRRLVKQRRSSSALGATDGGGGLAKASSPLRHLHGMATSSRSLSIATSDPTATGAAATTTSATSSLPKSPAAGGDASGDRGPLLRIGKVDKMRRMRRTSQ